MDMFARDPIFSDRRAAGRHLAGALLRYRDHDPLVLALPRGGVPVAFEVARALGAELDVLLVRKIGAPGQEELGLGALVDGSNPDVVWNEDAIRLVRPSQDYLAAETQRQLREIERRRRRYLGDRPPVDPRGRTVIVIDDGIATGGTVRSALRALRRAGAKRVILAVPVCPGDAVAALREEADDVVCLAAPDPFYAVGLHYADFDQTSDEEVTALLAEARDAKTAANRRRFSGPGPAAASTPEAPPESSASDRGRRS
jgi:putative phosphoribosyl transferase